MIRWNILIVFPILVLLLVIQMVVLPLFPLLGVTPQLTLLFVLAWGFRQDLESAIFWSFVAGFLLDLFSPALIGTTSIVYMAVVLATRFLQRGLPEIGLLAPAILAGIGTFLFIILEFVVLRIAGFAVVFDLATASAPLIFLHGLLIIPAVLVVSWWQRFSQPVPVQM